MKLNFKKGFKDKKTIYHIGVIAITTILFLSMYIFIYKSIIENVSDTNKEIQVINDSQSTSKIINNNDIINQDFESPDHIITGIAIKFSTSRENLDGEVDINVIDTSKGITLYDNEIDIKDIINNEYYTVNFDEDYEGVKNDIIEVKIVAKSLAENSGISIMTSENDICLKVISDKNTFIVMVYHVFCFAILLFIYLIYYLTFVKKSKIEKIFLLGGLFLGLLYVFILPPKTAPDEERHLTTAYKYSNMLMGIDSPSEVKNIYMRVDDHNIISGLSIQPDIQSYRYIYDHFFDGAKNSNLISVEINEVDEMPYLYLPAAFGMTIARMLHLGTLPVIFAGRIFMLLAYVLMTFFAIKKTPIAKSTIFIISLFPMALELGSSFSYDAIIIGLSFLLISYGLYIAYGKDQLRAKDIIMFIIFAAMLAAIKGGVYMPLCAIALIIPMTRFKNGRKSYLYFLAGIFVTVCIIYSIKTLGTVASIAKNNPGNIVEWANEPGYTVDYLLHNPLKLFTIIANTFIHKGDFYYQSMIGSYLGWLNVPIMLLVINSFGLLFLLSIIIQEKENIYVTNKSKVLFTFIICISFALICASMLLGWTPISYSTVEGVQGRYFIPLLLIASLIIRNNRIVVRKQINNIIIFTGIILQCIAVSNIIMYAL